ncbi:hypothetical protein [Aquipuribacter hungaricus]|uniref:Uncharacterized protein n=1 Tax=Aquipuribacter hungaricus TaxID=545624 RepID=A0ABV7WKT4_9MICO
MGMRDRLTGLALRRVHVLVVEVPGWWSTRVEAQQQLSARGWREASSPADADVLLVCGLAGDQLDAAVQRVWEQLPGPRARCLAESPTDVEDALQRAAAALADRDAQQHDARDRDLDPGRPDGGPEDQEEDTGSHQDMAGESRDRADMADMTDGDMDHDDMDHDDMDEDSHDMAGMDHGDMDHGDMEMAPAGIPLAGGGEDRDGLEMDVLQVPLGPVLPCWPAGLVLHCSLQGDVVVAADVEVLTAGTTAPDADLSRRAVAARLCDQAGQVLELSGWGAAARRSARVRDALLGGVDATACAAALRRLRGLVEGSRLLRWSLRDLGPAGGDVHGRLLQLLRSAGDLLQDAPDPVRGPAGWTGTDPQELPRLVTGLDLAAVRLVVASCAPDTARLVTAGVEGG